MSGNPKIKMFIKTVPGRETLPVMLQSLRDSDWPDEPIIVQNPFTISDRRISERMLSIYLFGTAMTVPWEYMLFCEDDVIFGRHFHHNIQSWKPLITGMVSVASLYGDPHDCDPPTNNCAWINSRKLGGALAILIRRDYVPKILMEWEAERLHGHLSDLRIYQAMPHDHSVPRHVPSLVQHQDVKSLLGSARDVSKTFDYEWKA